MQARDAVARVRVERAELQAAEEKRRGVSESERLPTHDDHGPVRTEDDEARQYRDQVAEQVVEDQRRPAERGRTLGHGGVGRRERNGRGECVVLPGRRQPVKVTASALVEASVATGVMQEAMDVCSGQSEPTTTDAQ